MKLHQTRIKSKQSFNAALGFNFPWDLGENKDSIFNKNPQLAIASPVIPKELPSVDDNVALTQVPLFSSLGQLMPITISSGNICIIGESNSLAFDLSCHIKKHLANNNCLVKIISLENFLELILKEKIQANYIYIVQIRSNKINPLLFKEITPWFKSFFVFGLPDLKLICGLQAKVGSSSKANAILASLGGNFILRRYLIAALENAQFLVISNNKESIRGLRGLEGSFGLQSQLIKFRR